MAQYKTPNVYVKEASTLSTSVVEVATAVPAFVGFTELTEDTKGTSLLTKPVRITSMLEYEATFGGAYAESITVSYNENEEEYYVDDAQADALSEFFLYQSVQHFFANGGGACYIVTVGDYVTLTSAEAANAVTEAEGKLETASTNTSDAELELNNLFDLDTLEEAVESAQLAYGSAVDANGDSTDDGTLQQAVENAESAVEAYLAAELALSNAESAEEAAQIAYDEAVAVQTLTATEDTLFDDTATSRYKAGLSAVADVDEVTLLVMPETTLLDSQEHYDLQVEAIEQAATEQDRFVIMDVKQDTENDDGDAAEMRNIVASDNLKYAAAYYPYVRTSIVRSYSDDKVTVTLPDGVTYTDSTGTALTTATLAEIQSVDSALYNTIKSVLRTNYLVLPPSAAVAGCITKTDNSRGVWKAPANVALAQTIEPMVSISDSQQETLNVDTTGKSINAIRAFVGKGNLIWGARTLDGNDLEWRYVSVRRLFNMVEESIAKATAFAVFEPNTALTWLKLKIMCENYLRGLWQQGAFTGASESEAFYVKVGTGDGVMSDADVLSGLMKIQIGLAASRPAEFIELTFQHHTQNS